METDNKSEDPQRPARIIELCKRIAQIYTSLQKKLSEKAQELGYSKDVLDYTAKKFEKMPDNPNLSGVEDILKQQFSWAQSQEKDISESLKYDIGSLTLSSASTAGSTFLLYSPDLSKSFNPPLYWLHDRKEKGVSKIDKLDPELGKTFGSVWELFYGTTKSPEKAALFAMRQSFDHLFRILAPEDKVKDSEYFVPKSGTKDPNQVYRTEKIKYAANTRIKDQNVAELLAAQSEQILKIYEQLNKMHSEKKLERAAVQQLLTTMQNVLDEWIDAIDV